MTITARDAADYREHVRLGSTELAFIPNSVPAPRSAAVARPRQDRGGGRPAGRLKRYDVLIRAFAKVVAQRPDWQLRIYGHGKLRSDLRAVVHELKVHNNVLMMGGYSPIEPEWAKGSIAAVPSDREPFGMTLVEAMRCGVPWSARTRRTARPRSCRTVGRRAHPGRRRGRDGRRPAAADQ